MSRRALMEAWRAPQPGAGNVVAVSPRPADCAAKLSASVPVMVPGADEAEQFREPRINRGGFWRMAGWFSASEASPAWVLDVPAVASMVFPIRYQHVLRPGNLPTIALSVRGLRSTGKALDFEVDAVGETLDGFDIVVIAGEDCRLKRLSVHWDAVLL